MPDIFNIFKIAQVFRVDPALTGISQSWYGAITDDDDAPLLDDAGDTYLSWDE
jgi:hypothetical protein